MPHKQGYILNLHRKRTVTKLLISIGCAAGHDKRAGTGHCLLNIQEHNGD